MSRARGTLRVPAAALAAAWLGLLGTAVPVTCLWLPNVAAADRRADLDALREAIAESRERVDGYERQQRGLLEAVEALDRAAQLLARELAHARRRADAARDELAGLEAEKAELAAQLAATSRAMEARAVALYRAGERGTVRLLFSAAGLPEFLSRVSALRRLLTHDAELVRRHRLESAALAEAEVRARDSAVRLAEAQHELEQRSAELAGERRRKRQLATRLRADRARERAALEELEKAARALEETLANLGSEPPRSDRELPGPPFLSLRRRLDPPVDAPILRGFGRELDAEFLTETFHSGVLFEGRLGTPVRAVAAARVRFAGWFRGYGRMLILDHGDGYFTVSGHLDEIAVEVDDVLGAGEAIGSVGETGSLLGPRLYFEIRHGGDALDPTDWLRTLGAR